jgi:hypothetical protein
MDPSETARLALLVNTSIGTTVTGILVLLGFLSLIENRKKLEIVHAKNRWRISLFATALFSFVVFILDGTLVWISWTGHEEECRTITIPHLLFYLFEKQGMYLFLYDRAKIVHESLKIERTKLKYLKLIRTVLWLTLALGVPIGLFWSPFIAYTGVVYPAGNCVFFVIWPVLIIVMIVLDVFLEAGMLLIFLIPLYSHSHVMNEIKSIKDDNLHHAENMVAKVIRRNIIYSSIALASCLIAATILATMEWIANGEGAENQAHLRIWASFSVCFDNLIGVSMMHCMTSGWMSTSCRKRFHQLPNPQHLQQLSSKQTSPEAPNDNNLAVMVQIVETDNNPKFEA